MKKLLRILIVLEIIFIILSFVYIKYFFPKDVDAREYLIDPYKNKVCFLPESCFESNEGYLKQFPHKKIPEHYPECLVYCDKNG